MLLPISLAIYGCADGPMFALKKMNPYYTRQWAKDTALGPTYHDRLQELRLLNEQIATMPPAEQQQWVTQVDAILEHDPSPEMRRTAVLILASVPDARSFELLQRASKDDSEKVRMAVCTSAAKFPSEDAVGLLQNLLQTDKDTGVKSTAIASLGQFKGPQAQGVLAEILQERSPAMQYAATQALAKSTGMHYGGDVSKWKSYLAGELVADDAPSLAEQVTGWIPFR